MDRGVLAVRLSVRESDPGYDLWVQNFDAGRIPRIFLDGEEQKEVVTADDEAGIVIRAVTDADGHLIFDDEEYLTEEVSGDVLIVWK